MEPGQRRVVKNPQRRLGHLSRRENLGAEELPSKVPSGEAGWYVFVHYLIILLIFPSQQGTPTTEVRSHNPHVGEAEVEPKSNFCAAQLPLGADRSYNLDLSPNPWLFWVVLLWTNHLLSWSCFILCKMGIIMPAPGSKTMDLKLLNASQSTKHIPRIMIM